MALHAIRLVFAVLKSATMLIYRFACQRSAVFRRQAPVSRRAKITANQRLAIFPDGRKPRLASPGQIQWTDGYVRLQRIIACNKRPTVTEVDRL